MIVQRGQNANARPDQQGHIMAPDAIMDGANGCWREEAPEGEGGRWRVDKIGNKALSDAKGQRVDLTERLNFARLRSWVGVGEIEEVGSCKGDDEAGQGPEHGRRPKVRAQQKSKVGET